MIRCYVTNRREGDIAASSRRAIDAGVEIIQIREKDLPASALFDLVRRIRDMAAGTKTRVVVNDRLDIALAAGVEGVHLPTNGLPPERVRPLVSLLTISTHSLEETIAAEHAGADFVIFGPVFETPGKRPVGVEALRAVCEGARVPILALGGITSDNAGFALRAGAAGIAAIRLFQAG